MNWMDGPMDDEPIPRHDDGRCIAFACPRQTLVEDGTRISYCDEHLGEYSRYAGSGGYTLVEMKVRPNVVHSSLLSLQERSWLPQTPREMGAEWPNATKVEAWAGFFTYQLDTGQDWTWRSVALAWRAFHDRPVRLVGNMLLIPQAPALTTPSA